MLKEICFQLHGVTVNELRERMGPLLADLAVHEVKVSGLQTMGEGAAGADKEKCGEYAEGGERKRQGKRAVTAAKKEEIMYLVDQGDVYMALREAGRYVLPLLHEYNQGEIFPGAFYAVERLEEMDYASFDLAYRRLAGLPWEILTTKRCVLRETTVEDVDSFYRIYAEPSITEYMENLFADKEEERAYIREYIEKVYAFYGYGMWTALEKERGTVIGRAGISWREGYDLPELGFVFGVPWQGIGYAYEVCSAILHYAKEELEMMKVQALVQPENERSLRLCEKLGFVPCGEVKEDGRRHLLLVKEL